MKKNAFAWADITGCITELLCGTAEINTTL